jgi:hypothetical protein
MASGIPSTVHEIRIPQRFRSWMLHFEDPVLVLREFIRWFEGMSVATDGAEADALDRLEVEHAQLDAQCRRLERDRKALVEGLIELGDLLDSPALMRRVTDALGAAGVEAVDVAGERFDPARHRAVDRVATGDPDAHGLIVETERLGYVDRGRHTRLPEVAVYHHGGAGDGG